MQVDRRKSVEQAELARPDYGLDACAHAKEFVGLLQVFLDGALRDAQDLAGIDQAILVTRNAEDFRDVPGLDVLSW